MTKFIIRLLLLWLFHLNCFSVRGTDSLDLNTARALFKVQKFQLASLQAERVAYFSSDEAVQREALLLKVSCNKALHRFRIAANTLSRISLQNAPDSMIHAVMHQTALCNYLDGNFQAAENDLLQMKVQIKDSLLTNQSIFLKILVLNEREKWPDAKLLFDDYLKLNKISSDSAYLYSFINERKTFKSRKTARVLSSILPGSGQIYAGKFWRGMTSLTLQGLAVAFGIQSLQTGYFVSAVFAGLPVFSTLYEGGGRHAVFLVAQHNREQKERINNAIRKFILRTEVNNS